LQASLRRHPSACLYEDQLVHAFKDINPQAPVHFLVIPKRHIGSAAEIDENNSKVVARCFEIIARLAKELKLEGFRIVSNCGESAARASATCISMCSRAGT
jgi:histidine triad (HIT) family protein